MRILLLALALAGCATIPTPQGPVKIYYPMQAQFDGQGRLLLVTGSPECTRELGAAAAKMGPDLAEVLLRHVEKVADK